MAKATVRLSRSGLVLGGETIPLLAGSVHYFRHEPDAWLPALEAVREMGLGLVDTYVPWSVHERAPGDHDFGEQNPRLDLPRFLRLCQELSLHVIVRPGPHVNAEITHFGIPERVIWEASCQARSAQGKPVVLPVPPLAFPVPSYASRDFLSEAKRWLSAAGRALGPHCFPEGPVVLCQIDNEAAFFFRDGAYDQDYHPDALRAYWRFLERKYGSLEALSRALGEAQVSFEVAPPRLMDARRIDELTRHLDWAEAQEAWLAEALSGMRRALEEAGVTVPFSHNLPVGEEVTPLDPERLSKVVDLIGLDYYHRAGEVERRHVFRRTSGLVERSRERQVPAFACELGVGFPPFLPPIEASESLFVALTALAYGLTGFNLYMAVARDRWIGAPYDARGRRQPGAELWQKLTRAVAHLRLAELSRETAVHLVIPRGLRRLERVVHAFGPVSPAAFLATGWELESGILEDDLDLGAPPALEAEALFGCFEAELERRRIPFSVVGGDLIEHSLAQARWSVILSGGGLEPTLARAVAEGLARGSKISIGPRLLRRDQSYLKVALPDALGPSLEREPPLLLGLDPERLKSAIDRTSELLSLPHLEASPAPILTTVLQSDEGRPRVLFAINPTRDHLDGRLGSHDARAAVDVLRGETFHARLGAFEMPVLPHSVRMLALEF